jgi:hypothetical protein
VVKVIRHSPGRLVKVVEVGWKPIYGPSHPRETRQQSMVPSPLYFSSAPPRPVAVAVGATVVETLGTGSTRREEDRRRKEQVSLVPMFGLLQIVSVCVSSSASIYMHLRAS